MSRRRFRRRGVLTVANELLVVLDRLNESQYLTSEALQCIALARGSYHFVCSRSNWLRLSNGRFGVEISELSLTNSKKGRPRFSSPKVRTSGGFALWESKRAKSRGARALVVES